MKVRDDEFMVCDDCAPYLASGDASHLDYHYCNEDDSAQKLSEIQQGERDIVESGGQIVSGDSEKDDDFSTRPCHCCGCRLHGRRVHFVILEQQEQVSCVILKT